ncbi:unnamed protein product [Fraxinus pennsylvanica]|uniref:Peptidylprolyl isomerase n=1 Tax=Fraxinus pennsylvanica TaxID=56036 RepID=A0AAD1ZRU2_9LAMI|nr:unnamed protein product [Fraxinus pennsylvanica]
MARIKPQTLLQQSKKKKGPSRISVATTAIYGIVVVGMVLFIFATCRYWSRRSNFQMEDALSAVEQDNAFDDTKKVDIPKYAVISTSKGLITVEIYNEGSPEVVKQFVVSCLKGRFKGMFFNRVIKNFVIQGGDDDNAGTTEDWTLKGKHYSHLDTSLKHEAFMLGTSKTKHDGGRFDLLITTAPIPDLNEKVNVFGRVIKGEDVVQEIEEVDTDEHYRPKQPIAIIEEIQNVEGNLVLRRFNPPVDESVDRGKRIRPKESLKPTAMASSHQLSFSLPSLSYHKINHRNSSARFNCFSTVQKSLEATETKSRTEYKPGILDNVFLNLFRKKMVQEIGWDSEKPGYDGLIDVAHRIMIGRSNAEATESAVRILRALFPPLLLELYKMLIAPIAGGKVAAIMVARVTAVSCQWLMGPCTVNTVNLPNGSSLSSGVFVEKCKYLEESKCVGVCINTCKLPTQTFFKEHMGVPLAMEPNFSDYSCQESLQ